MTAVRIDSVEVLALAVSPPGDLAALRALRGEWVHVCVTGGGVCGYGEATHSGDDVALASLVRAELAPSLVGRIVSTMSITPAVSIVPASPVDGTPATESGPAADHVADRSDGPGRPATPDALVRGWFPRVDGRLRATVISAIEQALWDLAAQATGLPLWKALAPHHASRQGVPAVPLYATLNRGIFDRSPEGFAQVAKAAVAAGFGAVKCAPFDVVIPDGNQPLPERDEAIAMGVARVAAVREAIGPHVALMVDCHGRFTAGEAPAVARQLAPFGLRWLEEPVPFLPDPAVLARVRQEVPVPIAAGELLFDVEEFRPLLASGAVDIIMPDVKHCGGLAAARAIASLAAEYGVLVAPHNPSGPVSTLASAHLCASVPNAPLLEYAWGEVPWRAAAVTPPERIITGTLSLADRPGLGAMLDPATAAAHQFVL